MNSKLIYSVLILFLIQLSSCTDGDEFFDQQVMVNVDAPIELTENVIAGVISDFDGFPIEDALVVLSKNGIELKSSMTDEKGQFRIDTDDLPKERLLLSVSKDEYLDLNKLVDIGPAIVINSRLVNPVCNLIWEERDDIEELCLHEDRPMITISGFAFANDGRPAANNSISVVNADSDDLGRGLDFIHSGAIQVDGSWELIVPQGERMRLRAGGHQQCTERISIEIGPFAEDAVVDDITNLEPASRQQILFGLPTCGGQELEEGIVLHFFDGTFTTAWYPYKDGQFQYINFIFPANSPEVDICQLTCPSFANILLVYDYTTNQYAVEKAGNDEFVDFGKIEACQNLDSKINLLLADNPIELYQPSYVRKSIYDPDGQAQEQFGIIPLANQTDMPDAWITMFGEIQASAIYTDNVRINISNNRISGEEIWDLYEGTVTIDEVSDGYIQ